MKTWPKYLLVNVDRLIAINWVPKKSNAYVNFPYNKPLSLEALSFPGVKEGEEELPGKEDEEEPEFEFNLEALAQLISMGFTENASKRALKQHNNDVNNAMNWIFSKTGDDSINLPLDDGKKSKGPKFNME